MANLKQTRPILLASESPRRIEILRNAGINFKVKTSPYDEPEINDTADEVAKIHALGKIVSLLKSVEDPKNEPHIYLGVDTIVLCDGDTLFKPKDREDARRMLELQQGSTSQVISGLAIIDPQTGQEEVTSVTTEVFMSNLSPNEIEWYLDTGEWEGKSGGFAIQGLASRFFKGVDGDILNVIGLPLNTLYTILMKWGVFSH